MSKHLHIVCLTVPYPVDYGGVYDLFYKLPALQQAGVSIHLHCFDYGRGVQKELNKYCETVRYYNRKSFARSFGSKYPHIVASRINQELLQNLAADDHPILMEGIHCSYPLVDEAFRDRNLLVRLHNIESEYYRDLASNSNSFFRRIYYKAESSLLHQYQHQVAGKGKWLAVNAKDVEDFKRGFNCNDIEYLPLFLPPWQVSFKEGKGKYCLYQGDLSVSSNNKMAEQLIKEIFSGLNIPFVIAGKQPSKSLINLCSRYEHINLVADPATGEMQRLISDAQVNIIPSLSATGIKLKLLNALYNGRHCLVNLATVQGTGLDDLCTVSEIDHMAEQVEILFEQQYDISQMQQREVVLNDIFDNAKNARRLTEMI